MHTEIPSEDIDAFPTRSVIYHPEKLIKTWKEALKFQWDTRQNNPAFTLIHPPPNVTGELHIGHALGNALQDLNVRWHIMLGDRVAWNIGLDHASISTELVVRRYLKEQGINDKILSREAFLEHAYAWKETCGGKILHQMVQLGCLFDPEKTIFTLDPLRNKAVFTAFVKLFEEGKIYKDQRLVNWDPGLKTALSDLEVENREEAGMLWYIVYKIVSETSLEQNQIENAHEAKNYLVVATTRPETLFGDVAIAVHPKDTRYTAYIGKNVRIPLCDRIIPIIADEGVDPEKGSGVLKITPAHDPIDFAIGKRHGLKPLNILRLDGCLNETVPFKYQGLTVFQARTQVIADLELINALQKRVSHIQMIPYRQNSTTRIEPYLTWQWFLDTASLAQEALKNSEAHQILFHPSLWLNIYQQWLKNMEPWCISRQLLWGQQIPVWYGPDGHFFCALNEAEAFIKAKKFYGYDEETSLVLTQETDVLDTWFSSALWPFSVWEWPDKEASSQLKNHYPADLLITGFDIIFFWVARMGMMGGNFLNQAPFRNVLITPLVRDKTGKKMSKSVGNVVNPMDMIEIYGADALRFALVWKSTGIQDLRFDIQGIDSSRKFITKLWNSVRLGWQKGMTLSVSMAIPNPIHVLNQWIVMKLKDLVCRCTQSLTDFHAADYVHESYVFWWHSWCDIYLEGIKILMENPQYMKETQDVMGWGTSVFLRLMHPIIPWTTDTLWNILIQKQKEIEDQETKTLLLESWFKNVLLTQEEKDFLYAIQKFLDDFSTLRSLTTLLKQKCFLKEKAKIIFVILNLNSQEYQWLQKFSSLIPIFTGTHSVEIVSVFFETIGISGTWHGGIWKLVVPQEIVNHYEKMINSS
jgi:valyl-tRNA synthetase